MQNNNQRKRDNFIKQQMQRFGNNIWSGKSSIQLQKDAKRVFKDIAFGNFDAQTDGIYLTDRQFLDNAYRLATSKCYYYDTVLAGVELLLSTMQPANNDIHAVVLLCKNNAMAWSIIRARLADLYASPDYGSVIICMINQLKPYKENLAAM